VDLDPSASVPVEDFIKSKNDSQLEELKQTVDSYIGENDLGKDLQTSLQNNYLVITIPDRALFDSGSAQIKSEFISTITSIGSMMEQYPQYEVVVSGHTDNVPINTREFPSNWDLSSERALNIMKLVLQNPNLDPQRFSAGYGEYRPVSANDTAAGRTKNRRVEVTIKQWDGKSNNLTE
jgi:chemotaxis protein MotB